MGKEIPEAARERRSKRWPLLIPLIAAILLVLVFLFREGRKEEVRTARGTNEAASENAVSKEILNGKGADLISKPASLAHHGQVKISVTDSGGGPITGANVLVVLGAEILKDEDRDAAEQRARTARSVSARSPNGIITNSAHTNAAGIVLLKMLTPYPPRTGDRFSLSIHARHPDYVFSVARSNLMIVPPTPGTVKEVTFILDEARLVKGRLHGVLPDHLKDIVIVARTLDEQRVVHCWWCNFPKLDAQGRFEIRAPKEAIAIKARDSRERYIQKEVKIDELATNVFIELLPDTAAVEAPQTKKDYSQITIRVIPPANVPEKLIYSATIHSLDTGERVYGSSNYLNRLDLARLKLGNYIIGARVKAGKESKDFQLLGQATLSIVDYQDITVDVHLSPAGALEYAFQSQLAQEASSSGIEVQLYHHLGAKLLLIDKKFYPPQTLKSGAIQGRFNSLPTGEITVKVVGSGGKEIGTALRSNIAPGRTSQVNGTLR